MHKQICLSCFDPKSFGVVCPALETAVHTCSSANLFWKILQNSFVPETLFNNVTDSQCAASSKARPQYRFFTTNILTFFLEAVLEACVLYFFIFCRKKVFQKGSKIFFISSKTLFSFSRHSIFFSFFPSFPQFPDSKGQKNWNDYDVVNWLA